jgi:hypothetical protein
MCALGWVTAVFRVIGIYAVIDVPRLYPSLTAAS